MTIKKFLAISVIFHALILSCIYFIPADKEKKPKKFYTTLVVLEELRKPEVKIPQKKVKKLPPLPKLKKKPHATEVYPAKRKPKKLADKPVVPGEGEGSGKPHTEGKYKELNGEAIRDKKGKEKGKDDIPRSGISDKPGYIERKELFDNDTIEQIARKEVDRSRGKDKSITFDTEKYWYTGYLTMLKDRIENSGCWFYPTEAAAKGIYGDLKIQFTIKKNGKLGSVELIRTSGYKMLDDAAMAALRDCGPYWPLPDGWDKESYTIKGHFIYSLYGYYFR